jgi:hypothetical protein
MENKLNQRAIEEYAHVYSNKLLSSFFKNHERIDGGQILSFSSIKQVNLFVLKALYEQWQRESVKLRSPYFDYEHQKVKEAMKVFLNSLSRHISVAHKDFEPLLHKAVADTLTLTLAPTTYFSREVERHADPLVSISKLKDINKYIQINKILIQAVINELEALRLPEAFAGEVVRLFHNAHHDNKLRITEWFEIMDTFNAVVPVQAGELLIEESGFGKGASGKPADEAGLGSPKMPQGYFSNKPSINIQPKYDADTGNLREGQGSSFSTAKPVSGAEFNKNKVILEDNAVAARGTENRPSGNPVVQKEIEEKFVSEKSEELEPEKSLNERFSSEPLTLNEKLKREAAKPTLIDHHQRSRIDSIRSAIPLNQRFMLINDLFNGDNISWSLALQELDNSVDHASAMALLRDKYARQYRWNMDDGSVQELISLVERKFPA